MGRLVSEYFRKGEVLPFICPCGKTVPFTEGPAVCESCGHTLTKAERKVGWKPMHHLRQRPQHKELQILE